MSIVVGRVEGRDSINVEHSVDEDELQAVGFARFPIAMISSLRPKIRRKIAALVCLSGHMRMRY